VVAFPALWLLGLSLAQVHVLAIQGNWSLTVWLVMAEVPVAFVAGGLLAGRWVAARAGSPSSPRVAVVPPLRWLSALLLVGWLGLTYQFARANSIPLLSSHVDSARTALNGGGAAILTDALTVSGVAAIAIPGRLLSREAVPALGIAGASLAGWALAGGRGTVVLPVVVGLLARWLYWRRPSARALVSGAIVIGGFLSFLFYLRTSQDPSTQAFPAELYGSVLPRTSRLLVPLLPLHFAIAMNFEALARVIDFFPAHMAYGHGAYDLYALHSLLPARQLGAISATLTAPWQASTAAGPLWADGGAIVVAAGMLAIGALTSAPLAMFRRSRRFSHALVASYFLYIAVFCLYTDLLTQYKDWVVVALGLLVIGRVSEGVPLQVGSRIKTAFGRHEPSFTVRSGGRLSYAAMTIRRRPSFTAALMLLLVAVVGAAVVAASERGTSKQRPRATVPVRVDLALLGGNVLSSDTVLVDSDLPTDNSQIWAVRRLGSGLRLTSFTRNATASYAAVTKTLRVSVSAATQFAMASYGGSERLYMITPQADRVTVSVVDPSVPNVASVVGHAVVTAPTSGTVRSFFVAHWAGTEPDLFVVDRGSSLARLSISIYSGDSRMARLVLSTKAPIRGVDPRNWVLQLARIDTKPDLVLVARRAQGSYVEAHALTGESAFQQFSIQLRLAVSSNEVGDDPMLIGNSLGSPSVLVIDHAHGGRVDVFPLRSVAPNL
jgi:hypothetical protein